MRQYKFRGKDSSGIWRYGHLLTRDIDTGCVYIREMSIENVPPRYTDYEVDPKSVGQWTGIKDRIGVEIYEGDILKFVGGTCDLLYTGHYAAKPHLIGTVFIVQCLPSGFTLQLPMHIGTKLPSINRNVNQYFFWSHQKSLEVIGSLHETPELITENTVA